ncbi:Elongator subunit elp4 [Marasmius crinis-equi]|uniref:Elongator complex protein 4 n=1 Tax=Marasmius crinis-equi TaxID=585013 RepID=A0ABR3FXK6_9AGAR
MSSFKRKGASQQTATLPGTRQSPGSAATTLTSTGIPSLDDLLGGGLPLSCSLVIAAPDPHSSYGELVEKYFVAQSLVSSQDVMLITEDPMDFVKGCMWTANKANSKLPAGDDTEERSDEKIKIAWRYENMKQFQTTVGQSIPNMEDFCSTFELSSRIPEAELQRFLTSGQLTLCDVNSIQSPLHGVIARIEEMLSSRRKTTPLRISIPGLGSPSWGDVSPEGILSFLQRIRVILRRHAHVCVSISLPPYLSAENWGGRGWIQKIGWLSDAVITLAAFTSNPSMTALFPSHHGLVHIHTLPAPHTLLPPSDRFSVLRGLSAAAADATGSGENNLAFKCTRKRLVVETLHLDVEGGVSERRTTPSGSAQDSSGTTLSQHTEFSPQVSKSGLATIDVELESKAGSMDGEAEKAVGPQESTGVTAIKEAAIPSQSKAKKPKKKVGFRSDRPDVYDF